VVAAYSYAISAGDNALVLFGKPELHGIQKEMNQFHSGTHLTL
jgi:hypothetical protein